MNSKPADAFAIKRIYLPADAADGARVLVDRLWPRGVSKREAAIDLWLREIAPSTDLRQRFGQDPARFDEFRRRYIVELRPRPTELAKLHELAHGGHVTLVYSAHDETHNQARVLAEFLRSP